MYIVNISVVASQCKAVAACPFVCWEVLRGVFQVFSVLRFWSYFLLDWFSVFLRVFFGFSFSSIWCSVVGKEIVWLYSLVCFQGNDLFQMKMFWSFRKRKLHHLSLLYQDCKLEASLFLVSWFWAIFIAVFRSVFKDILSGFPPALVRTLI